MATESFWANQSGKPVPYLPSVELAGLTDTDVRNPGATRAIMLAQSVEKPAAKPEVPLAAEAKTEQVTTAPARPAALDRHVERTNLETQFNGLIKGRDLGKLLEDLNAFERRAKTAGISDRQIAETYSHVTRLLAAPQVVVSQDERVKIARGIVRNAAKPGSIDQGHHGTCNVSVVEARVYSRTPEAAAKLVTDVATTGSFKTADGFTITPTARSLKPDEESGSQPPQDGRRGLASQVFQMTAANIHWQRRIVTPDNKVSAWGQITYEQIPSKRSRWSGDTGERVMDYSTNPPRETTKYGQGPSLSVSNLTEISNQITGLKEKDFVIENTVHGGGNTIHVSSPKDLETAIVNGGANGTYPMFIRVHTGNDPFLNDIGGNYSRQRGVWHVVSVTGYDPKTRKVSIDNQWGSGSDRNVDLEQLYKSTMEPGTPEWKKKHEFFLGPFKSLDLTPQPF